MADSTDSDRPAEEASDEALAEGLRAQLELLWDADVGELGMAVDFDPGGER
jgi:hypothetical protein